VLPLISTPPAPHSFAPSLPRSFSHYLPLALSPPPPPSSPSPRARRAARPHRTSNPAHAVPADAMEGESVQASAITHQRARAKGGKAHGRTWLRGWSHQQRAKARYRQEIDHSRTRTIHHSHGYKDTRTLESPTAAAHSESLTKRRSFLPPSSSRRSRFLCRQMSSTNLWRVRAPRTCAREEEDQKEAEEAEEAKGGGGRREEGGGGGRRGRESLDQRS